MERLHALDRSAIELARAEHEVALTNALIELQRQLLEHLYQSGEDITSAKLVFDSLVASLACCVQRRHHLRLLVNSRQAA